MILVNSPEELHGKEAAAARRERGVKAVAWILYRNGQMEEKDADDIAAARKLAEAGMRDAHASSASYRVVKPDGKTKLVEMISPHDNFDW